jgi:hypothetical protein
MADTINRTIDQITFPKRDFTTDTDSFFESYDGNEAGLFRMRYKIEQGIQAKDYECLCSYCNQPVKLIYSARQVKGLYFQHLRNSGDCPVKLHKNSAGERRIRAMRYHGTEEGQLHREIKELIGKLMEEDKDVTEVRVDKLYRHSTNRRKWRKPDVFTIFGDRKLAIEIQRSRTFLSTIVGRDDFYRENNVHILWVFPSFSVKRDAPLFAKDICYNHCNNMFFLDEEAQRLSHETGELVLNCFYQRYSIEGTEIKSHWVAEHVNIHDLVFDTGYKVYFHDSEREKQELEKLIGAD